MAYCKSTGTFRSSNGKDRIRYYIYKPEGEIRAILQISHGMCEYMELYEEAIDYFSNHGILVCGHDHLGHGASVISAEEFGYFAEEDGWIYLVKDLKKLNRYIRKEYPNLPCYLLGHSMGSFIARLYTAQYGKSIDGAIYMGTSGTVSISGIGVALLKMYRRLRDSHYRSTTINSIIFGAYNNRFLKENDTYSWLCQNEDFRRRYITDERNSFILTLAGFEDLVTMLHYISMTKYYEKMPQDIPYLLLSGTEDPVGNYGKGVKEVYEKLAMAGCLKLTMKLYEGQRHVLFQESVKEEVMEEIFQWIEKQ